MVDRNDAEEYLTSDSDEEENTNLNGYSERTLCLFCECISPSIEEAIKHLTSEHNVDLIQLKNKFHMDQYSFMKLINCIRQEKISVEKLMTTETIFWNDEKYLKPGEYESWLIYDYEELLDPDTDKAKAKETSKDALNERIKHFQNLLEQAHSDMTQMRSTIHKLIEDKEESKSPKKPHSVANKSPSADENYFSSYSHFSIHHEMLSDKVRTISYRDALFKNKDFIADKDVLDVGCGTGILSIFAKQAGAKEVIGIDNSDIVYNAMDIVKNNNISNVQLIKGRLEESSLPIEKYDIIISEWMGYFLLFEGMLDSVIYARDHHLKPGGVIMPNRCTISLLGYGNDDLFKQHVTFWNDVYGLNMSNMRRQVLKEPLIDVVDAKHVLTNAITIADFNLEKVDLNYNNFKESFVLHCTKDGSLSAFVGYFDTFFELPEPVSFSTGPQTTPTHWKQVVFFLEKPITVKSNDDVNGIITCRRSRYNARSLDITIEIDGAVYNYYLD